MDNQDYSILQSCLDKFYEEVLCNQLEVAVLDLERLKVLRVTDWALAIALCSIATAQTTPGVPLINVRIPVIDFTANENLLLEVPSDVFTEIPSFHSGEIALDDFWRLLSDAINAKEINEQIPPEFLRIQSH
ncbi:MAG: hypothetical protein R3C03_06845 [Pirellulaceae bacterium]